MITKRYFLTGLAAGIAAPLIVPRSSLMAMPRAPLVLPGDIRLHCFNRYIELRMEYFDPLTMTWRSLDGHDAIENSLLAYGKPIRVQWWEENTK